LKYNQPFGAPGANDPYINGNPSTGTMGSIPPAASIEFPQRELVNLIAACGLTPDNADLYQLARSIQSGKVVYGVDTGSATAYAIALNPPLLAYTDGLAIWVLPGNANTGPATFNVNGLGARNIVRRGGAPLAAGDMPQGYKSLLTYNALHSNFELYGVNFSAGAGFLPILTANTTLYVNGSTGDDSLYDGTTAAISGPHGPFKTITRAMQETFKYGPSLYTMTINIAAGSYAEMVQTPQVRGPSIILQGAGSGNTFITGQANNHTVLCGYGNFMVIHDLCASCTVGSDPTSIFASYNGAYLETDRTASGTSVGRVFFCDAGARLSVGNHTFNASSNCLYGISAQGGGSIMLALMGGNIQVTYTFGGTVNMGAFASAQYDGIVYCAQPPKQSLFANTGFMTGAKYSVAGNGVIASSGNGPSFFPGTTPGAASTGGQYV
jgi:hypothetical protein